MGSKCCMVFHRSFPLLSVYGESLQRIIVQIIKWDRSAHVDKGGFSVAPCAYVRLPDELMGNSDTMKKRGQFSVKRVKKKVRVPNLHRSAQPSGCYHRFPVDLCWAGEKDPLRLSAPQTPTSAVFLFTSRGISMLIPVFHYLISIFNQPSYVTYKFSSS